VGAGRFRFRTVIAPSFADIFANNSAKNGFLTVTLREEEVAELMRRTHEKDGYHLTVDLEQCEVYDDHGFYADFEIAMISSGTACWKASMTSASHCSTSRKLPPTRRGHPVMRGEIV